MPRLRRLFISTGDASGCQHAKAVVEALHQHAPDVEIAVVGDDAVANLPNVTLFRHHDTVGMGRFGVLQTLQGVWGHARLLQDTVHFIDAWQPDAVLVIDYGGYHLQLLKALKQRVPCYYYIPPQVWASRGGRTRTIKATCRHVFAIFPFEEAWYQRWQVPCTYVGHPLLHQLPPPLPKATLCQQLGLALEEVEHRPWVGLFPGSRRSEVQRLLPTLLAGLARYQQQGASTLEPLILLAQAPNLPTPYLQQQLEQAFLSCEAQGLPRPQVRLVAQANHALLANSTVVLGASGTTSLEAALYGTPMIITYKVDALTATLARRFVTVPYVGLPNLLAPPDASDQPYASQPLLPELLQEACTPEAIAQQLAVFLTPTHPERQRAVAGLQRIRSRLVSDVSSASPLSPSAASVIAQHLLTH